MSTRLVQVGLDHQQAPVAVLGEIHANVGTGSHPGAVEGRRVVTLVTCHRVEAYFEDAAPQAAVESCLDWLGGLAGRRSHLLSLLGVRVGEDAARHLLRVAAGLDSVVLGEDQVLGQVREAYRAACGRGSAGPLLHRLFHAAFRTGKRVRSETRLGGGGRSLAGSGVGLLCKVLGPLASRSILVLGAGEMSAIAARRLRQRGAGRLLIANRTWERAVALASELAAEPLPWDWRRRVLPEVDGVLCATSAREPVLQAAWLEDAAGPGRRLRCVVDLAVPADVAIPEPLPDGLVVADVDAIGRHLADDERRRRDAIVAAGGIVEEEVREWLAWVGRGEAWRSRRAVSLRENLAG